MRLLLILSALLFASPAFAQYHHGGGGYHGGHGGYGFHHGFHGGYHGGGFHHGQGGYGGGYWGPGGAWMPEEVVPVNPCGEDQ